MRVQVDTKGKMNRNESHGEKNRGPMYVPRFVIYNFNSIYIKISTLLYVYNFAYKLKLFNIFIIHLWFFVYKIYFIYYI